MCRLHSFCEAVIQHLCTLQVGHIEDVVVDASARGHNLGKRYLQHGLATGACNKLTLLFLHMVDMLQHLKCFGVVWCAGS